MSIDISKLENVRGKENKTIARCPACAELGQDKRGNHLIINGDGRFACVMFQGANGQDHRKRIFRIAGIKDSIKKTISVKQMSQASQEKLNIRVEDVLGRIGQQFQSPLKNRSSPEWTKEVLEMFNGTIDY